VSELANQLISMRELAADPQSQRTPAPQETRRGRPGILPWLVVPALVFFVGFAVIPLIGVFVLSFTT